jgi:hypothetical protein
MRNISDRSCREYQDTYSFDYFFPENRADYEIMLKNVVQPDRPRMTIQYGAFLIARATNRGLEHVIIIGFSRQKWLGKRASVLRYTYTASLVM